jgi:hypothetical protein
MLANLKSYLRHLLKDTAVWDYRQHKKDLAEVEAWKQAGRPVPPPEFVKRVTLADYGAAFGIDTLIETGTFLGGALYALKDRFKTLYSVELSTDLAVKARHRFRHYPHIHILNGDSGALLPQILSSVSGPCLFWLDGHYSGGFTALASLETPILAELRTIFDHQIKNHVMLIDDARLFDGTHDYPTIEELRVLTAQERPDYDFSVVNDIIRIHPRANVKTTY